MQCHSVSVCLIRNVIKIPFCNCDIEIKVMLNILTCMSSFPACKPGRFGPNCQFQCDCDNGGACDPVSGSCICRPAWIGSRCDIPKGMVTFLI